MKGGDKDQIPPKARVMHESRQHGGPSRSTTPLQSLVVLLRAFLAPGHYADSADSHPLENVHHFNELLDCQITIRTNDHRDLRVSRLQRSQRRLEVGPICDLPVELKNVIAINLNDLCLCGIDLRLRSSATRNNEIDAILNQRRCDHEDDQKDKAKVEQWRHVQLGQRVEWIARTKASHARWNRTDRRQVRCGQAD